MGKSMSVRNLNAWYGTQHALKNINIELAAKMATAIIGPSGCGKSTFIRCLNRMHETSPYAKVEGDILLGGDNLCDLDPVDVRRVVGMVFQKPNPFPTMSIFDNIAIGLRLGGIRKPTELRERVERSLRMAALWDEVKDRLNKPATALSGGQQQRLCIARALAVEPDVLLMDEPASALDPISTMRIEELVEQLKADYTVVIVTHNMQQAARIADRTAFFLNGELIEFGETSALFTKPHDKRTEDYITGRFG
ncbi:phosphate import ATP-binding protein PstB [Alicyclobacillus hesperidum]|uniref:Phosphate ABC transporter ATP-binding protein, PhoT family n=1 Tax=Alicyclobacillus hesperidum TaxID=89784 RepID=A0A1H2TGX9_9BACL|nr:phosphate ABC transporter ATP-binding protein PstB [Alicyclobacillus hesperidum]GLV13880.1 phosphate import ATP-binding protein PstB [Alicyclobacillus hesperidum]SDW42489.1 phosphate ABC transporter ATP-binding protein, PhoT family [Alicyclobacillus hesperidum]